MDDLLNIKPLEQVRSRALRKLRRDITQSDVWDAEYIDALARELYADKVVPREIRQKVMRNLVQNSPGGLLALSSLCASEPVPAENVAVFAANLDCAPPINGALNEKDSVAVLDSVLRVVDLARNARIGIATRILASSFISTAGRTAALQSLLSHSALTNADRKVIFQWALGIDIESEISKGFPYDIPVSPNCLIRQSVTSLVELGDDPGSLVSDILNSIAFWPEPKQILSGIVDILEKGSYEVKASVRRQALDECLSSKDMALRRRAYGIAVQSGNKDYLHNALKDPSFEIRSWAISQLK